jgi:glycosyltransferase involved in cell wall biosynthesis
MKILILSNSSMGLYKFRKELLEALIGRDNEVYVSVPFDEYVPKLELLGCRFINTSIDRRGTNPIKDIKLLFFYINLIKCISPDIVLTYTIKPNVYGGIACRVTKTPYLTNITGLGTSVENKSLIQRISLTLYRIGLKKASCVFFQNEPNRQFFIDKRIIKSKNRLIPGSGVNLKQYKYEEYPNDNGTIKFLFIGRIMRSKGVDELLEAAKKIKAQYSNVQFDLIGFIEENYSQRLKDLECIGVIKYHGQQNDVQSFIKQSHATILPSYHEGMSNVLLESASTGRPVLASKVTGCIETFDEGVSGFGFQVKNVNSMIEAVNKFITLPYYKKVAMGIAARKKMEKEFDRNIVVNAYLEEIYSARDNKGELL